MHQPPALNPRISRLHEYPFERLARLKQGVTPPAGLKHIAMSIGEPQHPPPAAILQALAAHQHELDSYPSTAGLPALRAACAAWMTRRFALGKPIEPDTMVLPVCGTREGLFSFVQTVVDARRRPIVVMPNPFYQIYEGAALLAGAEPYYQSEPLEAVPAAVWERCALLFICTPGNPTGATMNLEALGLVLELANRYGFVVASDECYAELYQHDSSPPPSIANACERAGRERMQGCVAFHSLSKRSSVPGLRSGFAVGDPAIMKAYLQYRTYHGCALPLPTQHASIVGWNDDAAPAGNRALYREKFARVLPVLAPLLDVHEPDGAFYLWPHLVGRAGSDDEAFARGLFETQNVTVLPGSYLARETRGSNPGRGHVRISLVPPVADCVTAAERIATYLRTSV